MFWKYILKWHTILLRRNVRFLPNIYCIPPLNNMTSNISIISYVDTYIQISKWKAAVSVKNGGFEFRLKYTIVLQLPRVYYNVYQ